MQRHEASRTWSGASRTLAASWKSTLNLEIKGPSHQHGVFTDYFYQIKSHLPVIHIPTQLTSILNTMTVTTAWADVADLPIGRPPSRPPSSKDEIPTDDDMGVNDPSNIRFINMQGEGLGGRFKKCCD
jgi:hypothetical protein